MLGTRRRQRHILMRPVDGAMIAGDARATVTAHYGVCARRDFDHIAACLHDDIDLGDL
jgi:hypothetical protein